MAKQNQKIMAKISRKFIVNVTISHLYGSNKGKVLGYAQVKGIGYWHEAYQEDWDNQQCDLDDIASFDVESVLLQANGVDQEATLAYRMGKVLNDTLAECIDNGTLAHMEYLFSNDYQDVQDIEYTELSEQEYAQSQQYSKRDFEGALWGGKILIDSQTKAA